LQEIRQSATLIEMAWCASFQLGSFGECRERFDYGVLPRCALCPLFDSERAIRARLREDPAPAQRFPISLGPDVEPIPEPDFTKITDLDFLFNPDLLAQLEGELPDWMDLSPLIPDFPPEEWGEPAGGEPPG
jgi:hypothetical protein